MSSSCILNTQLFVVHCFFSFILGGGGVIGFLFQRFTSRKRGRELLREDQMPMQCEVNFKFCVQLLQFFYRKSQRTRFFISWKNCKTISYWDPRVPTCTWFVCRNLHYYRNCLYPGFQPYVVLVVAIRISHLAGIEPETTCLAPVFWSPHLRNTHDSTWMSFFWTNP